MIASILASSTLGWYTWIFLGSTAQSAVALSAMTFIAGGSFELAKKLTGWRAWEQKKDLKIKQLKEESDKFMQQEHDCFLEWQKKKGDEIFDNIIEEHNEWRKKFFNDED